ncbi:TPA: hypothetical protein OME04_000566 [Klebsiella oxytoca]|nr:hypothetical protein [Klebsiella oxytoca]
MTSKLTKERIEWLHYAATGLAANGTEMAMSPQDVIALTECCLAAMDSEPVVFTDERNLHHIVMGRETSLIWGKQNQEAGDVPLYRHAQQPVVPPMQHWEELCREHPDMSIGDAIIRAAWWNHCRAAMLQAGNSPVIPDGYVMVPKEMTDEIGEAIAMQANCCGGIALDIYDAMLAAAPQEVK